jgi:hypothetical protein
MRPILAGSSRAKLLVLATLHRTGVPRERQAADQLTRLDALLDQLLDEPVRVAVEALAGTPLRALQCSAEDLDELIPPVREVRDALRK